MQTPTPAPPVQTPTPTPEPTPTFNDEVVVEPVRGTVLVCPPRSTRCVPLRAGDAIPMGSTIDTKKGEVELTSLPSPRWHAADREVLATASSASPSRRRSPSSRSPRSSTAPAAPAPPQKKPKSRKLWGDGKGKFRTKGRYAAATVRGTKWLVQDACTTTLVRVTQGSVSVRDQVRKRNVIVRKGKSYTARARR